MKPLRIGTRGSVLALAQTQEFLRRLQNRYPGLDFRILIIKTQGDEFQGVEVFKQKKTGVFTRAIERKLLNGEIDVAVHSLKDLPTDLPRGLVLAAFPKRERPGDVLVSRPGHTLAALPRGAVVGTGSPRRKRQLLRMRPDLNVTDIRGNLDTRVNKVLRKKTYDAIVVAEAGLRRLGKYLKFARRIPASKFLPAVGQGALGIQVRRGDRQILKMVRALNDVNCQRAVLAERAFLRVLQGGCRVPVGIHSRIRGDRIVLSAAVFSTRTADFLQARLSGRAAQSERAGRALARKLLEKGAGKFLKEARADG